MVTKTESQYQLEEGERVKSTNCQKEVMRHALGLNRSSKEYRNYFVTGEGSDDFQTCEALVALNFMVNKGKYPFSDGDNVYSVTPAGRFEITGKEQP